MLLHFVQSPSEAMELSITLLLKLPYTNYLIGNYMLIVIHQWCHGRDIVSIPPVIFLSTGGNFTSLFPNRMFSRKTLTAT